MTVVLVTGIDGKLAGLTAGILAAQPGIQVIGVGRAEPYQAPADVAVAVCDMRGDTLLALMRAQSVDVVIHLDVIGEETAASRDSAGRGNVYRAIEMLGACRAAGVPRVVIRSSTLVYGARADAPAYIAETAPLSAGAPAGLLEDYIEIERVAGDFSARHPDIRLTMLRCAGIVGGADSPLTRYLTMRNAPMLAGFDPRIQMLHAHDAAVAFALATLAERADGAFNIAAAPPFILSQAINLAGGSILPLPRLAFTLAPWIGSAEALAAAVPFPLDYLRHACVGDTQRALRELRWEAQHQPEEILRSLAAD